MFPPFPQEEARHYCQDFISQIADGSVFLNQVSKESQERKGHGLMIGALVCADKKGRRIVLHAVSGISIEAVFKGDRPDKAIIKGIPRIIVPAIVSSHKIEKALAKNDKAIHSLTERINDLKKCTMGTDLVTVGTDLKKLTEERTRLTDQSLKRVFDLYSFYTASNNSISLKKIIEEHDGQLPPTGTGDCCAPKLLSYAFKHGFTPLSMDEIFYGRDTPNKKNGSSYPPCDERCGYILPWILGLEILYRDSSIVVINKASGLLSVPGRGPEKEDCASSRLKKLFPLNCIEQPSVHRLDMETSGLLVMALTQKAHKKLSEEFSRGTVLKKYIALLDGVFPDNKYKGCIKLKFRLDPENRPHQIYDEKYGKEGITEWEKLGTVLYTSPADASKRRMTKILFTPHTGRTHQLRLASSDPHGLGIPIAGDSLYGNCKAGERLMLHAFFISFKHPVSGREMTFECPPPKSFD